MNKPVLFFISLFSLGISFLYSQEIKEARLNPDGSLSVETIQAGGESNFALMNNEQKENFPKAFETNPTFKNQRGLTLADIDGDGIDEIFHAFDNRIVAIKENGDVLWEKTIEGTATYPPTVVDLAGDGTYQIIQPTGGVPMNGRVYLLDAQTGEDFSGWPLNFNNNMILSSAAVADLTGNGIMDIVFCERMTAAEGRVHSVDISGNPINSNWPLTVPGTPAVTPSLGDINNDGIMDVVFGLSSGTYFAVNSETGEALDGFPVVLENRSISYQSPILADLTGDDFLEIVGANHGDNPGFFILNHQGEMMDGWPFDIGGWTYTPPTVADIEGDGEYEIFFADRNTSSTGQELPVIYAFDKEGNAIEDMSVTKYGGTEGVMTIADINNDGVMEIIFPSVRTEDDHGFIHAYSLDGSGEIDGFPKRPKGFTFMNGAVIGATADNKMMLVANSHTTFETPDSTFVNVYDLNVPYDESRILSNGYKGDNTRAGLITKEEVVSTPKFSELKIELYPNPSDGKIILSSPVTIASGTIQVIGMDGKLAFIKQHARLEEGKNELDMSFLKSGVYILTVSDGTSYFVRKLIIN